MQTSVSSRDLFTDGWNSLWHFVIGMIATKYRLFVPLFVAYQFLDTADVNVFIDVIEFLWGYLFGLAFHLI
jgi:hypothetical protein